MPKMGLSLNKLDLAKVDAQKIEDKLEEEGQDKNEEEQLAGKPTEQPLVSARELEEIHEKQEEERKASQKKLTRALWSSRSNRKSPRDDSAEDQE